MKRVDLEHLVRRKGINIKHADYVIMGRDVLIIVEETSRPKLDDLAKLEETISAIKRSLLEPEVPKPKSGKIVAIIHRRRRPDTPVAKAARSKSRHGEVYVIVDCKRGLENLVVKTLA